MTQSPKHQYFLLYLLISLSPLSSQPSHTDSSFSFIHKSPRSFSPLTKGSSSFQPNFLFVFFIIAILCFFFPLTKHVCTLIHQQHLIPLVMLLFMKRPFPLNLTLTSFIRMFHKRYVILLLLILMVTQTQNNIFKPKNFFLSTFFSPNSLIGPTCVSQALNIPDQR